MGEDHCTESKIRPASGAAYGGAAPGALLIVFPPRKVQARGPARRAPRGRPGGDLRRVPAGTHRRGPPVLLADPLPPARWARPYLTVCLAADPAEEELTPGRVQPALLRISGGLLQVARRQPAPRPTRTTGGRSLTTAAPPQMTSLPGRYQAHSRTPCRLRRLVLLLEQLGRLHPCRVPAPTPRSGRPAPIRIFHTTRIQPPTCTHPRQRLSHRNRTGVHPTMTASRSRSQ